jgi:hypothetical protein
MVLLPLDLLNRRMNVLRGKKAGALCFVGVGKAGRMNRNHSNRTWSMTEQAYSFIPTASER